MARNKNVWAIAVLVVIGLFIFSMVPMTPDEESSDDLDRSINVVNGNIVGSKTSNSLSNKDQGINALAREDFVDVDVDDREDYDCEWDGSWKIPSEYEGQNIRYGSKCDNGQYMTYKWSNDYDASASGWNYIFEDMWYKSSSSDLPDFRNYGFIDDEIPFYVKYGCYDCDIDIDDDAEPGCLTYAKDDCVSRSDSQCDIWYEYETQCLLHIRECNSDNDCGTAQHCVGYQCQINPCWGFECGTAGGEYCGSCGSGESCSFGTCVDDEPQCTDTCTSEGFDCGTHSICDQNVNCGSCGSNEVCHQGNTCEIDHCASLECGAKSGQYCGSCSGGEQCVNNMCEQQWCQNMECGVDSGVQFCGNCDVGSQCESNQCVDIPDPCQSLECGTAGGENCGICGNDQQCINNFCIDGEDPEEDVCENFDCGTVAGEYCGTCSSGDTCSNNVCVENACNVLECGYVGALDCGSCSGFFECFNNFCLSSPCENYECGTIAGENCGTCGGEEECISNQCVIPEFPCEELECGIANGENCGTCGAGKVCLSNECELNYCINFECGTIAGQECGTCSSGKYCNGGTCVAGSIDNEPTPSTPTPTPSTPSTPTPEDEEPNYFIYLALGGAAIVLIANRKKIMKKIK